MSNRRNLGKPRKTTADNCLTCDRNDVPLVRTSLGHVCFECLGRMDALTCRVCNPNEDVEQGICEKHFNEATES